MDWFSLAKDFGIPLCLVLFFVLETKRREDRMAGRLDKVEDYTRTELAQLVQKNTEVMGRLEDWLEGQWPQQTTETRRQSHPRRKSDQSIQQRKID